MFSLWPFGEDDIETLHLKSLSPDQPFDMIGSIVESEAPSESNHSINTDMDMDDQDSDVWSTEKERSPVWNSTFSWDALHSRFPTYSQIQLSKHNMGSAFLTEAPLDCFESVIKKEGDVTVVERQLVESLIQAIVGRPSIYFKWDPQSKRFQSTRPVRILGVSMGSIAPIVEEILLFGGRMKAIEYVAKECQLNPRIYGSTGVAFACCLSELLLNIQNSLINMFASMKDISTILKVHQYGNSMMMVCERLCNLCSIQVNGEEMSGENTKPFKFDIPFGAKLLNLLYKEIQEFDLVHSGSSAFYRSMCLTILCYTSIPYLNILSKWLGLDSGSNGVFEDVYQEFFICKSTEPYDSFQDFQIRQDITLPFFINIDLSVYILRSGISLQLLRQAMPNHPLCDLRDELPLRCRLKISETIKYTQKINSVCRYIQKYNSGEGQCITENEELGEHEELEDVEGCEETQESTSEDIPSLPPWDEKNLMGEFSNSLNLLLTLINENNSDIIPTIDTIVALNYIEPVQAWCPLLNESYMSSFLHQFKLQHHLSQLYDIFLLGNGTFLAGLESAFFKNEDKIGLELGKKWPPEPFDLNLALRSILLETVQEHALFSFDVGNKERSGPNDFNALDFLHLRYNVQYPLNLVITPNIQLKYNRVFTFLVQLFRISTTTKRMYSILKSNHAHFETSTLSIIHHYRFQFDQFMRSLQGYVHDTVINETWQMFMEQVQDLNQKTRSNSKDYISVVMQPQMFKHYHEHILDRILYQCFLKQSQKRMFKTLQPILQDILNFAYLIDVYYYSGRRDEDRLLERCEHVFGNFQRHVQLFVNVLKIVEEKGSGRLGNILHSTNNEFRDLYEKYDAKRGLDVFVKDLLTRIDLNMYYESRRK